MTVTANNDFLDRRISDSSHFPDFLDRRSKPEDSGLMDDQRRLLAGVNLGTLLDDHLPGLDQLEMADVSDEEQSITGTLAYTGMLDPVEPWHSDFLSLRDLLNDKSGEVTDLEALYAVTTEEQVSVGKSTELSTGKLKVRGARNTQEDLDKLVALEIAAFSDVYGQAISTERYEEVRKKFAHRLEKIGNWIKVIEDKGSREILGMVVGCPTNFDHEELVQYDMTTRKSLDEVYDPDGRNLYILNLATHPKAPKNLRFNLLGGLLAEGFRSKAQQAYFESRLPGFNAWVDNLDVELDGSDDELRDELADIYWRQTEEVNGRTQPIDKLLRLYVQLGATPLRLVPEAWEEDKPSDAYGVLCEFKNPLPAKVANSPLVRKMAAKLIELGVNQKNLMQAVFNR